jgi:hypothetical protein
MGTGEPLLNHYEMVLKDDFTLEWYVTHKFPLRDEAGRIIGVAGINARAGRVDTPVLGDPRLNRALEHIRAYYRACPQFQNNLVQSALPLKKRGHDTRISLPCPKSAGYD